MTLREALLRYPLFAVLSDRVFEGWLASCQELHFAEGETVFQEGSIGEWLYLVKQGRVRITRRNKSGRELTAGIAGPGDVFGEYAVLRPHNNTATCRAIRASQLVRLPLAPLHHALGPEETVYIKRWTQLHAVLSCLRGGPFLGFMSAPSALAHLNNLRPTAHQQGATIQANGLADAYWHFIEQGKIALHLENGVVRELTAGDSFGEHALLAGRTLPVAIALEATNCLRLSRAEFYNPVQTEAPQSQTVIFDSHSTHHYPWVSQSSDADCGVASLAMIAKYYFKHEQLDTLRSSTRQLSAGLSLLELQALSRFVGLTSYAVRVDADHLDDVALPAIAHFSNGHYVVIFEHSPRGVVIGDPATSIVSITEEEFWRMSSGYLLLVKPSL